MGARIEARDGRHSAAARCRAPRSSGIEYKLPVASAQVKSCVLLAGLDDRRDDGGRADGDPRPHRADAAASRGAGAARRETGGGYRTPSATPTSSSSRASTSRRPVLGGVPDRRRRCIVPGSRLVLEGVGVNWTRAGCCGCSSGWAAIVLGDLEPAARSGARAGRRPRRHREPDQATEVEAEEVPLAIDELPLVALLGCFAEGETIVRGAAELRVKETDRIATVVDGLRGLGAEIEARADGFASGDGGCAAGVEAHGDHRLALLGAVAGLASRGGGGGDRDGGRRRSPSGLRRATSRGTRRLMVDRDRRARGAGKSTRGACGRRASWDSPCSTRAPCTDASRWRRACAARRRLRKSPRARRIERGRECWSMGGT